MSEPAHWELDAPWADAGVTTSTRTADGRSVTEHEVGPGGVLRFTDDTAHGATAEVISGEITLFRSTEVRASVLTGGSVVELAEAHWWRNDSGAAAVVRISRPVVDEESAVGE